jgi:3-hydroxyacyl-[acyl-carrier-protein] dehydratase
MAGPAATLCYAPPDMTLDVQAILPHRFPFLFIDRVVEVVPEKSVHCQKMVSNSDPILQGHFPGNPILPGVVQVEAMAQAAIVLAHQSGVFDPETQNCYFMGIEKAKFRAPVRPGEVLDIRIEAQRLGRIGKFKGEIRSGDEVKSSGTFTAIIEAKPEGG